MVDTDSESEGTDTQALSSDEDQGQKSNTEHKPTLRLSGGFQWDMGVIKSSKLRDVNNSESETEEKEVLPLLIISFSCYCLNGYKLSSDYPILISL